ncbi:unnamed protein product [Acanthoscelides obtectus]|nr:unnamed protein product [Acanthoscelides obtectus]CAK1632466.1 FH2 domain-containing protein 1 [Acanthoscelides obtectus]
MNLIHFVALQAEKKNRNLLSFTDNIGILEDAAKLTVEQLHNEINALDLRIKKIKKQIELPTTEVEIKAQMTDFLQMAEREVANLQVNLRQLEHVRRELSDFFCEDINSFKLEECFRIFHGFYTKFKQAVCENERRRIQEEQANERRRQREELLATKRRQMECMAGTPDSDFSIDLQIYDTRGFPMKKGRRSANGSGMSEDETSITGSPSFSRRRLGSFNNGNGTETNTSSREEKSPDITPNGSLRRRRSRVLSEDDEGNLMEFLRASGNDSNRERKSWGSLDRSWARKARGSGPRKRPALLAADFSSERERPSSPSPLSETKPAIASAPEEESASGTTSAVSKPREWRQKIESWLQASENDAQDEQRRRRNRRSAEMDSESERSSTLDTLPEGKQVYSGSQSNYRKIYPAWQPSSTIESTDVVGAMEAIEQVQPIKDKSAWRKSTLNVSNSSEEAPHIDNPRSRTRTDLSGLHSIDEDITADRKSLIGSLGERMPTDKLTLYIRRPAEPVERKSLTRRQTSVDSVSSNKVEIDQDNIETPPAVRKVFIPTPVDKREPLAPSPCSRKAFRNRDSPRDSPTPLSPEPEDGSVLGDGQFDRYSSTRRTRRYKRPTEPNEVHQSEPVIAEKQVIKSPTQVQASESVAMETEVDRETRLKTWQEKLKSQQEPEIRTSRRHRHQTGINQSDVEMALSLSKMNDNEVSRNFIAPEPIKATSNKIDIPSRKIREHDNDEGFEETQSLMSESPSQGASSGGNYEADIMDAAKIVLVDYTKSKPQRPLSQESKETIDSTTTTSSETPVCSVKKSQPTSRSARLQSLSMPKPSKVVEKSPSLRKTSLDSSTRKSVIPRRSDSIKKSESKTNATPRSSTIQKSNSRNSIVSSRSSLNSATSTSTVKKLPLRPNTSSNMGKPMQRTASNKAVAKPELKRVGSIGGSGNKPPRPQAMSFMKPTTSSTTKSHQLVGNNRASFRSKN